MSADRRERRSGGRGAGIPARPPAATRSPAVPPARPRRATKRGAGTAPPQTQQTVPLPSERLIYGVNPLREALRGGRRVRAVWLLASPSARGLEHSVETWAREAGVATPRMRLVPVEELVALSGTLDHQGVVAEVDPFRYAEEEEILRRFDLLLALDRVQDPQNLGAAVRSAEGAGAAIVIPRHRACSVTPAVVKASAGATEHAAICRVRNLADFLLEAKRAGFWVYGASMGGVPYFEQELGGKVAIVLGSEEEGLGRRVAAVCDAIVGIPEQGRVGSLNVSVAAGILLFDVLRRRGAGNDSLSDRRI